MNTILRVSTHCILAAITAAQSVAPPPVVASDRGQAMDRYLTASGFTGCALVAKDGELVLVKGYGEADREKHVPCATDTLVSIGSITKQFTAAAIMKLEMEGKLSTSDPITRFFPDAPADKRAITLHHLLTHTSGLDSDFAGDYDPVGRDEYVRRIFASKLRSTPGAEYFYANSGYSLLAAVVEVVSKEGYEAYLRKHVLLPADLRETGYLLPKWDARRVPVGYRGEARWGTMLEQAWADDGPYWALRGNGGIESTLEDLWKWSRALEGEAVLSRAAAQKMFTAHVAEGPGAESHYGYGWVIGKSAWGTRVIEHNGGNGIFSADFRRYVDDRMVVITFSNDSRVKAWKFSGKLARIMRGEDVPPERPENVVLAPLGDKPRHELVREFVAVFNTHDLARVRAFRAKHMPVGPDSPSEAERDRIAQRMFTDLGTLKIEGVAAEEGDWLAVRVRTERNEVAEFRFRFEGDATIAGLGVQVGG